MGYGPVAPGVSGRPVGPTPRSVPRRPPLLQGAPGRDGVGVVGAEDALADGEGAFDEEAGGGRVALVPDEAGEVVEVRGGVEVIGAEGVAGRAAW